MKKFILAFKEKSALPTIPTLTSDYIVHLVCEDYDIDVYASIEREYFSDEAASYRHQYEVTGAYWLIDR